MLKKGYEYAGVKMPAEVKEKLMEVAKKERRPIGAQALIFIEMGLREYERGIAVQAKELAEAMEKIKS